MPFLPNSTVPWPQLQKVGKSLIKEPTVLTTHSILLHSSGVVYKGRYERIVVHSAQLLSHCSKLYILLFVTASERGKKVAVIKHWTGWRRWWWWYYWTFGPIQKIWNRKSLCMLGNFSCFCRLLAFFKINFFKKFFQELYQSVIRFAYRSEPTFCCPWSGSKLFAKIISRR